MTVPSTAGIQQPALADPADSGLAEAATAAQAVAAVLPSGGQLTAGLPTRERPELTFDGQAACAHFAGSVTGEVVVVIGQDLVDALQASPLGQLDPAHAAQPALEAAVSTFGPVVVDPATLLEPAAALDAMAATGAAVYVPLLEDDTVRGLLALVVGARPVASPGSTVAAPAAAGRTGLDLLHDVEMEVTAELGRTRMTVRELLSLSPGTIVELDRVAGSPADLLVNGRLIASGEVVIIDENFGLRITEIAVPGDRG
jgi:flagellar motor switch protein FliN/FliY